MQFKTSYIFSTFILVIILSSGTIQAAKGTWEIWIGANQYNYGSSFTIENDYPIIKMRVRVFEGGPVSVFILDQTLFASWETGSVVVAYAGGENITSGTIKGQLGLARINSTGQQIEYVVIVDNRANGYYSNVKIDVIITVPASSVLFAFFALVPLALFYKRKLKR